MKNPIHCSECRCVVAVCNEPVATPVLTLCYRCARVYSMYDECLGVVMFKPAYQLFNRNNGNPETFVIAENEKAMHHAESTLRAYAMEWQGENYYFAGYENKK